jgi:alpha-galactosidase
MKVNLYAKNGDCLGQLNSQKPEARQFETCKISRAMLDAAGDVISIKCELPILDMHGHWSPDMFRPKMKLDWNIGFTCAAHRNFPYLSFFSMGQKNRGTIGTTNLLDDSVVSARMNQQTGNYDIEIAVSVCDATDEFEFFVDLSDRPWPEIMQDYRTLVRPDWTPCYPADAWQPVYCTWYAVHAEVEQQWLEEQAETATEMNFGTFIVDDGWCFDDMRRVTPQTIGSWYDKIGDWQISEKNLPDFKAHVERAQKAGLKYLLWVSPFMIGTKSKFYSEAKCNYLSDEHEGYRIFDPDNQTAAAKSMQYMIDVVEKHGLDGLKIDFVDAVPQSLETPRGRTVFNYMKKLLNTIKQNNPNSLFEFRQRYTTPIMLDQATQFRAGDVPFDFLENIHRIAQIRICTGDKVPVHADPVYWNPNESCVNVARHMICSIAGVPMVSMDLNKLPAEQRAVIEYWLKFYQEHLDTFKNGHWQVKYEADHLTGISVEHGSEKIAFVCNSGFTAETISGFNGNVFIMNICDEPLEVNGCKAFDYCGKTLSTSSIPAAGFGIVTQ